MASRIDPPLNRTCHGSSERGVVLFIALIAMVVIMIGATALVRSFGTSILAAGQLSFKKDLLNQSERAIATTKNIFDTGLLKDSATREADLPSANYSAVILASNNQGIPIALIDDSKFTGTASDITVDGGITIRYIIDRQCVAGTSKFDVAKCAKYPVPKNVGGQERPELVEAEPLPVYRITIRIKGPKNTAVYVQGLYSS